MSEDDATTDSTPTEADDRPPVACTITDERAEERATWMEEDLVTAYEGYDELEDGVSVRFDGADDTLRNVARFVAEEKECCPFADYHIGLSPPYEGTRLIITGPEGTKEMFTEEFVARMAGEKPLEPPSEESGFRQAP